MNNLAKLTLLLSAACPMLLGQAAPKAADPQPKAQSAAKQQAPKTPPPKAPDTAKEQAPQTPQPPPKPPAPPLLGTQTKFEEITIDGKQIQLETRIIKMIHADPYELEDILIRLSSDLDGTYLEPFDVSGGKGIIVKDIPSAVAAISRTAQLFDVPGNPADTDADVDYRSFDVRVDVIWAAPVGYQLFPTNKATPPNLSDVIDRIKRTLNYHTFTHGGTYMQKVSADGKNVKSAGAVVSPLKDTPTGIGFEWELKTVRTPENYRTDNKLRGNFSARYFRASIQEANIDLMPGQKAIIGTTMVDQDVAMIVVVSVDTEPKKGDSFFIQDRKK